MNPTRSAARVFHPRPHSLARLVCFPHAGGAASAFAALSAALPEDIELVAFQYPGRQDRRADPFAEDIAALAEEAVRALAAHSDQPLFLLGHSMGALTAFETARRMGRPGAVARLFASAARPPSQDWEERDLDNCGDREIVGELRRLGGVPDALLQDPETVREMLRLLRADHRALRRYRCPPGAALEAPITVLLAAEDPKNTPGQMEGWARHTTGGLDVEGLPGGHFSLTSEQPGPARRLARRIREDRALTADSRPPADAVCRPNGRLMGEI
ncbi:alpha/beta fold hydrolase (plasmid) [Streptomyces cynarae]|uniref:Alpha/beta fold hydrolase n=1 Tax=Streptomyces cynarae TaxID=2981134 RepID=A0ABY6EE92_9ACTN|nr:alpha/beta fold hydrolase [Streptomyces cynarae]UXY24899.1 alpha/beta fold hydrolase [Streptomyces cynarae]